MFPCNLFKFYVNKKAMKKKSHLGTQLIKTKWIFCRMDNNNQNIRQVLGYLRIAKINNNYMN